MCYLNDHNSIELPSHLWLKYISEVDSKFCKLEDVQGSFKVVYSVTVNTNGLWCLYIRDNNITAATDIPILSDIPKILTPDAVKMLLNRLNEAEICPAHPDEELVDFIESKQNQVLLTTSGSVLAKVDSFAPVHLNGQRYAKTLRPQQCQMLVKMFSLH